MKKIISYFVENSFIVNLISVFIVIVGYFSLMSMNRDLHPPFEFQKIKVNVGLPGATPGEIEKFVTYPLEESLKSVSGLDKYTSNSSASSASLSLYFKSGHKDIEESVEIVRSRINSLLTKLPQGIRNISVEQSKTRDLFLYWIGIENFDESITEHRRFGKSFEKALADISGVVSVNLWTTDRDVYVELNPIKLNQLDVSVEQVRAAIGDSIRLSPIGQMRVGDEDYSVELAKISGDLEKIAQLPLRGNSSGQIVKVSDVAEVKYKAETSYSVSRINGNPGITLSLRKDLSTDSFFLKDEVLKIVESFNNKAPKGLRIVPLVDGPQFVEQQINVLKKNGLAGFIFVVIALVFFLSWRTAFMATLGLPVAYFGTLIILNLVGINIDLISIIGMILVVGILVDDAIIVSERYTENLEKGLSPKLAATETVYELIAPVTGTVLTTLVAFCPILFLKSEMSVILAAVPIVVISALLLSWFESFFILPNHLAHFVTRPPKPKQQALLNKVTDYYKKGLFFTVKYRYVCFLLVILFSLGVGYIGATKTKQDFGLNISNESITVYAVLKESQSLEETVNMLRPIEDYLKTLPKSEVENITTFVGNIWMNGQSYRGSRYAKVEAYLNRYEPYPSDLKNKIKPQIEKFIEKFPRERFEKLYVDISREGGDEDKQSLVSVKIKGDDAFDFDKIEEAIVGVSKSVPTIKEIVMNPDRYQKSWEFIPNVESLALYGLTSGQIGNQVRSAFVPDEVGEMRSGGENVSIYLELKQNQPSYQDLSKLVVTSSKGVSVPLSLLGSWREKMTLKSISHHKGQRDYNIDFKINEGEGNLALAKSQFEKALMPITARFSSYEITVADGDEQQEKNKTWAKEVAIVCILGVMFIMALVLGSVTQPIIVGLPIPFGILGIILALYLHNQPLGLMALIGLVGVVGVSVNASIVMVHRINSLAKEKGGVLTREILIEGAASRLRAIVLTTITTLAGVFPMAYALGGESGFTQPLAFSLGWGLTFSTVLTLFLLPALLEIREDIGWLVIKIKRNFSRSINESNIKSASEPPVFIPSDNKDGFEEEEGAPWSNPIGGPVSSDKSPPRPSLH